MIFGGGFVVCALVGGVTTRSLVGWTSLRIYDRSALSPRCIALFMRLGISQSDAYFGIIVWLEVFSPYQFRFVMVLIQQCCDASYFFFSVIELQALDSPLGQRRGQVSVVEKNDDLWYLRPSRRKVSCYLIPWSLENITLQRYLCFDYGDIPRS